MKPVLITSSILILLLAALRPLLRGRIDPRLQYALWLVTALRLLMPLELAPSAYSALALLQRTEEPAKIVEAIVQTPIPTRTYGSAWDQALREYEQSNGPITTDDGYEGLQAYEQVEYHAQALMQGPTLAQLFEKYARPLWLGGAALAGLWFLLVNLRLRRKLRTAELVAEDPFVQLPVYVSDALPSPCLCGIFRPAIYVTPHAAQDPDRLRHVLAHESTHYRHRDHWWGLARCLCLCLYWFDPLVWWAAALSRQDCELACDAGAIRRLGEAERIPYGRTLVDMIAAGRCSLMQTATTMTGGRRRVRQRVRLIARKPKTVIAVALALVLVLGAAVGCTFTGAPEKSEPTTDNLQERLMDIPEELQGTVTAVKGNGSLVEYRLNVPADWVDEHLSYVLSVHTFQKENFRGWPESGEDILWETAAQDDTRYYVIHRLREQTYPSEYEYWDTHRAVRAFVEETLLATECVEPYSPDENRQPLDTLQARLMSLPEEWRDKVSAPDDIQEPGCLAYYWLNDPKWQDLSSGWLLTLYRLDGDLVQHNLDQQLWPSTGIDIFARSGDEYYAILWAGDGRYQDGELGEEYWAAAHAMMDHVMAAVLATEGVEPFDPYTTPPHFFSNVPVPPLEPGSWAIDGMDYTLVTSHEQVPEDPEQWYLVGHMGSYPVWMFTRGHGVETMFQIENRLTKVFPYTARFFGGGQTPDGHAPQLMPLDGFGSGPKGTFGPFAVITHVFQGGTEQQYQLTVYDLGTDPAFKAAYVHDWEPLMNDFNANAEAVVHEDTHSVTVAYQGASAEIQFDDIHWDNVQQYGFSAETYEYCMNYYFNDDGTSFDLAMPVNPFTTDQIAVWTLRFTGDGFETTAFRFVQSDDVYTYISTVH